MKARGQTWTREMEEALYLHWGLMHSDAVANKLVDQFGGHFTGATCRWKARMLGLRVELAQPYIAAADAARELGINLETLLRHCRRHGHRLIERGPVVFVPDNTWTHLQEHFRQPPEPTIGAGEAARRLNYTLGGIHALVKRGHLRSYRHGTRLHIPVAEVERLERQQRGSRLIGDAPELGGQRRSAC